MIQTLKKDEFGNILLPEVTSDGALGSEWIPRLKEKGYEFGGIGSTGGEGLSEMFFNSNYFLPTNKNTYQPVIVLGRSYEAEDRYVPLIKEEWLKKGYKLAPMELLPLLCNASFFPDFLRESKCRFNHCMHDPISIPPRFTDSYYLQVSFWNGGGSVDEESKTIKGVYGSVHMGFFSDCLFIFVK